jgi:hypothetical protein
LEDDKQYEEALVKLDEVLAIQQSTPGDNHSDSRETMDCIERIIDKLK